MKSTQKTVSFCLAIGLGCLQVLLRVKLDLPVDKNSAGLLLGLSLSGHLSLEQTSLPLRLVQLIDVEGQFNDRNRLVVLNGDRGPIWLHQLHRIQASIHRPCNLAKASPKTVSSRHLNRRCGHSLERQDIPYCLHVR